MRQEINHHGREKSRKFRLWETISGGRFLTQDFLTRAVLFVHQVSAVIKADAENWAVIPTGCLSVSSNDPHNFTHVFSVFVDFEKQVLIWENQTGGLQYVFSSSYRLVTNSWFPSSPDYQTPP